MTLSEAIKILKEHNEWRRGDDSEMVNPTTLGIAIDLIIQHCEAENAPIN